MARRDLFPGDEGFHETRGSTPTRRELFAATREQPRYFGTGDYGSGEGAFTGGYSEVEGPADPGLGLRGAGRGTLGTLFAARAPGGAQRAARAARAPRSYQRSDERIREDVCERLIREPQIDSSDVSVEVRAGIAQLEGTVPDRFMKYAIEYVAEACHGVRDVDNRIRVAGRAAPPLEHSSAGS